jgi:hypothetical protein
MATATINPITATARMVSFSATVSLGGGGAISNVIPRFYTYPTLPPDTPQAFPMLKIDTNGVLWVCPANASLWMVVNTVGT